MNLSALIPKGITEVISKIVSKEFSEAIAVGIFLEFRNKELEQITK